MPKAKLRASQLNVRIDPETRAALEAAAAGDEREVSDFVRVTLRRELRRKKLLPAQPAPDTTAS